MSKGKAGLGSLLTAVDKIDLHTRYKSASYPKASLTATTQARPRAFYIMQTESLLPSSRPPTTRRKINTKYDPSPYQPRAQKLKPNNPYFYSSASKDKPSKEKHSREKSEEISRPKKQLKSRKRTSQEKSVKSKSTKQKKQPSTNEFSFDKFSKTYRGTIDHGKKKMGKGRRIKGIRWEEVLDQYGQYLTVAEIGELRQLKEVFFLGKIRDRKNKHLFSVRPKETWSARKHQNCSQILEEERPFYNQLLSQRRDEVEGERVSLPADDFYRYEIGDHVAYRYQIMSCIDKGAFGEVLKVFDHKYREYLAMKIVKKCPQLVQQTLVQISLLTHIASKDKQDLSGIVRIKDFTIFRKHICIIFELLEGNLFDLIVAHNYHGMNDDQVRIFAIQLLNSLDFLKKENIIHCDLKPENIALRKWAKSGIKIIDFGTSCFQGNQVYSYLQSRYYRAPEIILGTGYSFPIDMWSLGCILAELKLGQPIFAAGGDVEHLMYIANSIGFPKAEEGPVSARFLRSSEMRQVIRGDYVGLFHSLKGMSEVDNHPLFSKCRYIKTSMVPLRQRLKAVAADELISLIERMLVWQPAHRITPAQALHDPWIINGLPKDIKDIFLRINQPHLKASKSRSKGKAGKEYSPKISKDKDKGKQKKIEKSKEGSRSKSKDGSRSRGKEDKNSKAFSKDKKSKSLGRRETKVRRQEKGKLKEQVNRRNLGGDQLVERSEAFQTKLKGIWG